MIMKRVSSQSAFPGTQNHIRRHHPPNVPSPTRVSPGASGTCWMSRVYLFLQFSEQNSSSLPAQRALTTARPMEKQKAQQRQWVPHCLASSCLYSSLQPYTQIERETETERDGQTEIQSNTERARHRETDKGQSDTQTERQRVEERVLEN